MELLLDSKPDTGTAVSAWRDPLAWMREKDLGGGFWVFFTAAFFFDAGFSVYFFLFNLYLLDYHFNERAMGLIGGALTLGSLAGTLPAGLLSRKFGVRPLLLICFVAAPTVGTLRTLWMGQAAQIGLAFAAGWAMCSWGVCFLPAVARLTTEKNRTSAFSLIFSVSIGTSALGGVICGYLPQWLRTAGFALQPVEVKRVILLLSCGIALLGIIPVLYLKMPLQPGIEKPQGLRLVTVRGSVRKSLLSWWKLHPFLVRFLPPMALWSAVLAAFNPFANIYLSRDLHVPLTRIGLIFSTAQGLQLCMGIVTPIVFRAMGLVNGIAAAQLAVALVLAAMAGARSGGVAVALYLTFSAAQWMNAPGLYNLLMNETPDHERSTAAAMTLFCNALAGSASTAGAGMLFTRFGYPRVLLGIAAMALMAAILFWLLISPHAMPDSDRKKLHRNRPQ